MASRLITINIRRYLVTQPRTKRARKAVSYVRERIAHYTKLDEESVKLSPELSALVFSRHAKSMLPVRASISIENGVATASPFKAAQPAKPATTQPQKRDDKKGQGAAGAKAAAQAQEGKPKA